MYDSLTSSILHVCVWAVYRDQDDSGGAVRGVSGWLLERYWCLLFANTLSAQIEFRLLAVAGWAFS
eukprot:m.161929 g.161929  ORF g.161929 m.161929 type:complete len:66 (-) comp12125_c0_seq1:64-261(-)